MMCCFGVTRRDMLPRGGWRLMRQSQRYVAVLSDPPPHCSACPPPPTHPNKKISSVCVYPFLLKQILFLRLSPYLSSSLFIFLVVQLLPSATAPAYSRQPCTSTTGVPETYLMNSLYSLWHAFPPSCRRRSVVLPREWYLPSRIFILFLHSAGFVCLWICENPRPPKKHEAAACFRISWKSGCETFMKKCMFFFAMDSPWFPFSLRAPQRYNSHWRIRNNNSDIIMSLQKATAPPPPPAPPKKVSPKWKTKTKHRMLHVLRALHLACSCFHWQGKLSNATQSMIPLHISLIVARKVNILTM